MKKFRIISLGCPKNLVDSEIIMGQMEEAGYEYSEDGEIVIINTCGFIHPAIEESEGEIREQLKRKARGEIEKVVIAGCLVQRKKEELLNLFPDADAVLGHDDIPHIVDIIEGKRKPRISQNPRYLPTLNLPRIVSTEHYAYVKIGEGCSRRCAFCTIPSIRGDFRSRGIEDIVEEAREIAEMGIEEIIVVAQDFTLYGLDIYGENRSAHLLEALNRIDGIKWIRIMYAHPHGIVKNPEIIDAMASLERVVPYIELPIQHISEKILRRMNRSGGKKAVMQALELIGEKLPDAAIRTEVIVGFPGEHQEDFEELVAFLEDSPFARIGVFPYYNEPGSASYHMDGQVDEREKELRYQIIRQVAEDRLMEFQRNLVGREIEFMVEGFENGWFRGRSIYDAPQVDAGIGTRRALRPGKIHRGKVVDVSPEGDLIVEEVQGLQLS